jgi:signal transduction histidine kinase
VDRAHGPLYLLMQRLVPPTMGARLVLTAVLIASTTTAVALGINATLVNARAEAWTRSDVVARIEGFRSFLAVEQRSLGDPLERAVNAPAFRLLVAASDATTLRREYAARLPEQTQADAMVGLDVTGGTLLSNGSEADVAALRDLATKLGSHETTGFVRIAAGAALACGSPVIAPDGSRTVGYLVVARLLDATLLARFDAMLSTVETSLHEPGYRPTGVTLRTAPADGGTVSYGSSGTVAIAVADLPAVGGGSAGTVELRDLDPRGTQALSVATDSAALAGATALVIGLGLGLWLAGIMRRPVARMIRQMRRRADAAAKGNTDIAGIPIGDPVLPIEFQELATVIDDLIRNLDARRIDLEKAVREAEYADETLSVVVNESPEAKIVLQNDRVVIANPAAAEAVRGRQADLVGHSATSALSGAEIRTEDGIEMTGAELVERALEERTTVSLTVPDGAQRWYAADAVRHSDERHEQVLLTARDVTEERHTASIRAEIISLVGHDLRSPLTVVIGYLDLLQRPMPDTERIRALDAARRNAARMADLLEDLLSATRAEELLAPSDLVPTSLTALAEEVVASLAPTHAERPLLLEQHCDPIVLGEEKRLRQVLVNLVTNAYKYSPEPEPIVVRIRCDERSAYVEVIDHGPGVPADEREHVFERFAQLRAGEEHVGMGLGLYIVRIIAHNHGGSARVEETPGGGATFVVELPLTGMMVDGEFVV